MRQPGRFGQMARCDEGREQLAQLIGTFLVAHGVGGVVLDIPTEKLERFGGELDARLSKALMPTTTRREIAAVTRRVIVDCLDELLEINVPEKAGAN